MKRNLDFVLFLLVTPILLILEFIGIIYHVIKYPFTTKKKMYSLKDARWHISKEESVLRIYGNTEGFYHIMGEFKYLSQADYGEVRLVNDGFGNKFKLRVRGASKKISDGIDSLSANKEFYRVMYSEMNQYYNTYSNMLSYGYDVHVGAISKMKRPNNVLIEKPSDNMRIEAFIEDKNDSYLFST